MLKNIKAAIFDLDGTLIDSLADIANSANYALQCKGFPTHPAEPFRYFVGEGMYKMLSRSAPAGTSSEVISELVELARERYSKHWADETVIYPGIEAMLALLEQQDVKLAVLSNKHEDFTRKIIQYFFPKTPFVAVHGSLLDKVAKPDPQLALKIAAKCKVSPDEVLFMGDTKIDMQTAVNAKMFPVGVLWGFRQRKELEEHGAKLIISQPQELKI